MYPLYFKEGGYSPKQSLRISVITDGRFHLSNKILHPAGPPSFSHWIPFGPIKEELFSFNYYLSISCKKNLLSNSRNQ